MREVCEFNGPPVTEGHDRRVHPGPVPDCRELRHDATERKVLPRVCTCCAAGVRDDRDSEEHDERTDGTEHVELLLSVVTR